MADPRLSQPSRIRRAVFVHGAVTAGSETWLAQAPLSDAFDLVIPDRQGYGAASAGAPDDPARDADAVATLLGDGAHLVGYSMGAMVAMLAAAGRPDAVASLVLVEPPAFQLLRGRPDAEEFVTEYERLRERSREAEDFLRRFLVFFGADAGEVAAIPDPMPAELHRAAVAQFTGAAPWDVDVPLSGLAGGGFPIVVVSGGHSSLFDAACDTVAEGVGAAQATIRGAGHAVQFTGEPFNELLVTTWTR